MVKRFADALIEAMDQADWSVPKLCAAAKVKPDGIKKFVQRARNGQNPSTNVDDAIKVASALGYTVNELVDDRTDQLRTEAAALWRELPDEERKILRDAARGRGVPGHKA